MAKNKTTLSYLMITTIIFFLSCTSKQSNTPVVDIFDETNLPAAEQLIKEAMSAYDSQRILEITDSLEAAGEISAVTADFYRGGAAANKGMLKVAEFHLKKATANNQPDAADLRPYLKAKALLSRILSAEGNYEGALNEALPTLEKMDSLGNKDYGDITQLYIVIGDCQQYLQMPSEAATNFANAYALLKKWMDADSTGKEMPRIILRLDNIATSYIQASEFEKAKMWLDREDSALALYDKKPALVEKQADFLKGTIELDMAAMCQQLGRTDEAARHYDEHRKTIFSQRNVALINATDYLMLAGRYAEAANNYTHLDEVFQKRDLDLSLENIGTYMLPKMRANIMAGRKDSAIAVGMKIIECYDSALIRQKQDATAELATVYNTRGKERQIAEQQMRLSRARVLALAVSIIALTIFFVIFTIYRHRMQRNLAEYNSQLEKKNELLTEANARAEESAKMKTNFIQQISHEIRTPLNILSGFTQVVTNPGMELDDETKQDINRQITENTERITGLVNKMLELSDVNSKTVLERTDQVMAIQMAAQAVEASAISMAQHLTFDLQVTPEAESAMLQTNLAAATRALSLLLDNARKFTLPPEAQQRQQQTEKNAQAVLKVSVEGGQVLFAVEDNGIGIPEAEAEHVFEEFVQLNEYYDGTGIGLTVARSLTRRLGGDIRLDTNYKGGARFMMNLPC